MDPQRPVIPVGKLCPTMVVSRFCQLANPSYIHSTYVCNVCMQCMYAMYVWNACTQCMHACMHAMVCNAMLCHGHVHVRVRVLFRVPVHVMSCHVCMYIYIYIYLYLDTRYICTRPCHPPRHGMGPIYWPHMRSSPSPPCGVVGVWHCPPPPLWCGGGVVWYVGYVWCVWSVWYGMSGWYCMDGRYGM